MQMSRKWRHWMFQNLEESMSVLVCMQAQITLVKNYVEGPGQITRFTSIQAL